MIDELIEQLPMATPLFVLAAGFVIGLLHAFEPDHVAAVSTQIARNKTERASTIKARLGTNTLKSSILGALWGAGHTSTLVLIGALVFLFSLEISEEIFSGLEFVVGVMLVFLGASAYITKRMLTDKHVHPHMHGDGTIHTHTHTHSDKHKHGHRSYLIGCIHGLAGSGSLVVLVASTFSDMQTILSFILVFGVGSILGMMLVSGVIALPFAVSTHAGKISRVMRYTVSAVSIGVGAHIMFEVASTTGMFGLHVL
jgi:sulfite exporter TauE/SafE